MVYITIVTYHLLHIQALYTQLQRQNDPSHGDRFYPIEIRCKN
jgi:hypothetical protein